MSVPCILCRWFTGVFLFAAWWQMAAMTLDGKDVLIEGWLTVYKSRNATFFTKLKVRTSLTSVSLF